MILRRATATVLVSIGVGAALLDGCAASDPSSGSTSTRATGTGSGGSSATGGAGGGGASTTGGGASTGTGGTLGPINPGNPEAGADTRITEEAACAGEPVRGEQRITDLYMMMDSTGSMDMTDPGATGTRWSFLAAAIPVFVNDPLNAGMMIGLDFFPEGASGMGGASCNVVDYTMPNVPVDFIPGANNAQSNAIIAAVQGRTRGGNTPTVPSLTGALETAKAWQITHPNRSLSVLYLTDGQPTGCMGMNNTVAGAAAVAQMYSTGTPPIMTYVLGVGPDTGNLDSIAAGGGTRMAYMAATGGAAALQAALAAIRKSTLSCDYNLPKLEGGTLDPNKVNVSVRIGPGGTYVDILNVGDVSGCTPNPARNPNGEGWYYDIPPPGTPTKITVCPNSCGPLQVTAGSELRVLLGCKTRPIPPPN